LSTKIQNQNKYPLSKFSDSKFQYPNPAADQLNISCEHISGEVQISIIDVFGKLALKESYRVLNSDIYTTTLELGDVKSGVYFVRMLSRENISTQKFVVKLNLLMLHTYQRLRVSIYL
jgi:hypothetical protein